MSHMSRRSYLIATGAGAIGALAGAVPSTAGTVCSKSGDQCGPSQGRQSGGAQARPRERENVIIIGGGIAGVVCAWLLGDAYDITLLEKDDNLGGHARSITVSGEKNGKNKKDPVVVDIGAQYFGPSSHPLYWVLVKQILNIPTVALDASVTVFNADHDDAIFVSPSFPRRVHPVLDPRNFAALDAMRAMTFEGVKLTMAEDDTTTVEEFIEELKLMPRMGVYPDMRTKLLYPFAASMFGCSIADVKRMSALTALTFMVKPRIADPLSSVVYHNAIDGLQSVVENLRKASENSEFHMQSAATEIVRNGDMYDVYDAQGHLHRGKHVIFALPPTGNRKLLARLPGTEDLVHISERFEFFPSQVAIHRDPIYMPHHYRDWSLYNTETSHAWGESSMWLGAARPEKAYKSIFKSWVNDRSQEPRDLIASYRFEHALTTPDFLRAQRDLDAQQGRDNLWFAGSHMNGSQSQETALVSAIRVAEGLHPDSTKVKQLRTLAEL